MKKIILDTNALMSMFELKIDLFDEIKRVVDFNYEVYVVSGTIDELESIVNKQRGKYREFAKLSLKILKDKEIKIIKEEGFVDDILTDLSENGFVILTSDYELKKRLTKPYLIIRQKRKVELIK